MGKEGPCYHCGIEQTPLWRNGPPEKPVLCNACGSRWRTRGTLNDYTPKHAMRDANQNGELFPADLAVANSDHSSGIVGIKTNSSSSGSPSTDYFTDVANTTGPSELTFENLPRRKRSVLSQIILSPIERLSKQLFDIAHEYPEVFLKEPVDEDVFVDQATNSMSTPIETPLGAMLLASPNIKLEPIEYESSYDVKPTMNASGSIENGGIDKKPLATWG